MNPNKVHKENLHNAENKNNNNSIEKRCFRPTNINKCVFEDEFTWPDAKENHV